GFKIFDFELNMIYFKVIITDSDLYGFKVNPKDWNNVTIWSANEAKDAFEELIKATRQEAGCELYDLVQSAGESVWVMMEKWSSKSAWDAHMQTSHVKRINEIGPNFLEKPSELKILNPL
ncbi:MAG: putative quinol monooxygenase, partial [Candidatus Nanopelagicales bacterium]